MFDKKKLYVIGVSGGPDSMFCLDNLRQEGYKIIVAHVNYHKRIESNWDEQIIKEYCQKYSLPYEVYQAENIPKGNFQDQARQIRYQFFQQLAQKNKTKYIVVAHHLDDHLETYLFQKQRTSLVNYWGLSPKTKQGECWMLRPFLSFTKTQIIQYLNQKKITYATDSTNQLPIYQRNIIRQKLVNLSPEKKQELIQEIKKKTQKLKKTKLLVKQESQRLLVSPAKMRLEKKTEFSSEIYLRLLFSWINYATNGILQKRKRNLLGEIYKQLFFSKKKFLIIRLGKEFQIIKGPGYATIYPKTY